SQRGLHRRRPRPTRRLRRADRVYRKRPEASGQRPSHGRKFPRARGHSGACVWSADRAGRAADGRQAGPKVALPAGQRSTAPAGGSRRERTPMFFVSIALAAAAVTVPSAGKEGAQALAQPRRDPALLHRGVERLVEAKEREQERALRGLLALGGSEREQAEVTGRLANLLRSRGLSLALRAA